MDGYGVSEMLIIVLPIATGFASVDLGCLA